MRPDQQHVPDDHARAERRRLATIGATFAGVLAAIVASGAVFNTIAS